MLAGSFCLFALKMGSLPHAEEVVAKCEGRQKKDMHYGNANRQVLVRSDLRSGIQQYQFLHMSQYIHICTIRLARSIDQDAYLCGQWRKPQNPFITCCNIGLSTTWSLNASFFMRTHLTSLPEILHDQQQDLNCDVAAQDGH